MRQRHARCRGRHAGSTTSWLPRTAYNLVACTPRQCESCGVTPSRVAMVTQHAVSTQPVVEVRHHRAVAARALASVHLVRLPTPATRATNQRGHAPATSRTHQTRKRLIRATATLPTQPIPVRHQGFRTTIPTRLRNINHEAGPSTRMVFSSRVTV